MKLYCFFVLALILLAACNEPQAVQEQAVEWSKKQSTDLNKELAEQEKIDIQLYKERIPKSDFLESGSGLNYWIYEKGVGELAQPGQMVQISFNITLLDGTFCYRTEENEMEEFRVGRSQVETGVQEAMKFLRKGDKAKLIIPSHLAHGLTGDNNKIPPLTPIVVDLEVLNIIQ